MSIRNDKALRKRLERGEQVTRTVGEYTATLARFGFGDYAVVVIPTRMKPRYIHNVMPYRGELVRKRHTNCKEATRFFNKGIERAIVAARLTAG